MLVACASAAVVVVQWSLDRVASADSKAPPREITVIARPSALPAGARCTIELVSETNDRNERVEIVYEGKIARTTDDGITLTVTSKRQKATSRSRLASVPVVNRLFTNVGIGLAKAGEEKDVWIAAEKIRSVKLVGNGTLEPAGRP
jgi:hypothetical protein